MRHKSKLTLMILTVIIFSFPSICFSESKTFEGEYCEVYLGDMKNKKDMGEFRKYVREKSIRNGLTHLLPLPNDPLNINFYTDDCFRHVISNYLEKVVVISHTEKGRKICDKVKITFDPEVVDKYLSQESCHRKDIFDYLGPPPPHVVEV